MSRTVTAKCQTCERRFVPRRRDTKHCSPACRQRAYRARSGTDVDELDRAIEATRLRYWALIALKAHALGRSRSDTLTREAQYIDIDGNIWLGGVLPGTGGPFRRLGGKGVTGRDGWESWGLEAAGPPWAPPGDFYEPAILGKKAWNKMRGQGLSSYAKDNGTRVTCKKAD